MLVSKCLEQIESSVAFFIDRIVNERLPNENIITSSDIIDLKDYRVEGSEKRPVLVLIKLLSGTQDFYTREKSRTVNLMILGEFERRHEIFEAIRTIPDEINSLTDKTDQLLSNDDGSKHFSSRFLMNDFVIDSGTFLMMGRRYNSFTSVGTLDYNSIANYEKNHPAVSIRFEGDTVYHQLNPQSFTLATSNQIETEPIDGRNILKQLLTGRTQNVTISFVADKSDLSNELRTRSISSSPCVVSLKVEEEIFKALMAIQRDWEGYTYQGYTLLLTRLED